MTANDTFVYYLMKIVLKVGKYTDAIMHNWIHFF